MLDGSKLIPGNIKPPILHFFCTAWGIFWHLNEVCRAIFEKVMKHKILTLFLRRKSKKNGRVANLSTLFLPYGDFELIFALWGQIKLPFFEDDTCMCRPARVGFSFSNCRQKILSVSSSIRPANMRRP